MSADSLCTSRITLFHSYFLVAQMNMKLEILKRAANTSYIYKLLGSCPVRNLYFNYISVNFHTLIFCGSFKAFPWRGFHRQRTGVLSVKELHHLVVLEKSESLWKWTIVCPLCYMSQSHYKYFPFKRWTEPWLSSESAGSGWGRLQIHRPGTNQLLHSLNH